MYSFHFYEPIPFTHQEADSTDSLNAYPSAIYGTYELRSSLDAMVASSFLSDYPIFLGEFGCSNWNDGSGSDRWVSDVYQWCEEQGVHTGLFTYRSFADVAVSDEYGFGIFHMLTGGESAEGVTQRENRALMDLLKV